MTPDAETALVRLLRQRMNEVEIRPKALALKAGLGDTYVRDILKGRSRNPKAAELAKLARALDMDAAALMAAASTPQDAELVKDPAELLLLRTWRKLVEQERLGVLDYIAFRLGVTSPRAAGE
jgi:transcriptional regulator with XRE-family HTH domain